MKVSCCRKHLRSNSQQSLVLRLIGTPRLLENIFSVHVCFSAAETNSTLFVGCGVLLGPRHELLARFLLLCCYCQ